MADINDELEVFVGSWRVGAEVDPVEMAATHPVLQQVVRLDFDDLEKAHAMINLVAGEWNMEPSQVIDAMHLYNSRLRGGLDGEA